MLRRCVLQIYGLAIAMSGASLAFGQYSFPAINTNPVNPFNQMSGYAGNQMRDLYSSTLSSNQVALRNAQTLLLNTQNQPAGMSTAGRIGLGNTTSYSDAKPFSNYSAGPAVSPYLNLFRVDLSGNNALNYSTLVEPELRQQQLNQQQQRQNMQTTRRLQAIAAQADYNPQGDKNEIPTGHQTVYQYTGHYYAVPQRHQRRRAQQ
jgi:hypothetical protein